MSTKERFMQRKRDDQLLRLVSKYKLEKRHWDAMRLLIRLGASLLEVVQFLRRDMGPHLEVEHIQRWLALGYPIEQPDQQGYTMLDEAAAGHMQESIIFLCGAGAQVGDRCLSFWSMFNWRLRDEAYLAMQRCRDRDRITAMLARARPGNLSAELVRCIRLATWG